MRHVIIATIITLLAMSPCIAEEPTIALPHDQEAFFKSHQHSIELRLELHKNNIDTISPAIGQLKGLRSIALIIPGYAAHFRHGVIIQPTRDDVTIPAALLNLPNLRTLEVYGPLNLHLPPMTTIRIQSHIEQVIATYWNRNSISFLGVLPLHQLILREGQGAELPVGFDQLHNLRELQIEGNSEPLAVSESLCGFTNLERLELSTPLQSPLPRCLERLTYLKSVAMVSCRQESLPDKTKIYFPIALASLPNLEELTLWDIGRVEMPTTAYGLKKLQKLNVAKYKNRDIYRICSKQQTNNVGESNFDKIDLDNVIDYPELQKITVNADIIFKGSTMKIANDFDCDPVYGVRRFMGIIDAAWKKGKLPSLKQIDMWDRDNGDMNTIIVWRRPLSRDKSGAMFPKHDVNWMLKKEREKASSWQ